MSDIPLIPDHRLVLRHLRQPSRGYARRACCASLSFCG
jgi:hypothetical protein